MYRFWPFIPLLALASLTPACGNSGNRQLQSITINAVADGQQIQFVATGTFSTSPTMVSPLPVSWSFAPPPPQFTLTTEPFTFQCDNAGLYAGPIVAMAPSAPNAPSNGSISTIKMVTASGPINCL
jgi:hypothetical protein